MRPVICVYRTIPVSQLKDLQKGTKEALFLVSFIHLSYHYIILVDMIKDHLTSDSILLYNYVPQLSLKLHLQVS